MASPTKRTLKLLRESGATAQVVEHWNSFAKRRIDLFQCIDIVALRTGITGVIGYQACAGPSHSARKAKILNIPAAKLWIENGNLLYVISWALRGPRGKAKKWLPRIEQVGIGEFEKAG